MGLVVVLLFPFKVAQRNALVNPTQFRTQYAFHCSRMLRPSLVRHSLSVGFSENLSRHAAMNLAPEMDLKPLPHPRVYLFRRKYLEYVCTPQCIGYLAVFIGLS